MNNYPPITQSLKPPSQGNYQLQVSTAWKETYKWKFIITRWNSGYDFSCYKKQNYQSNKLHCTNYDIFLLHVHFYCLKWATLVELDICVPIQEKGEIQEKEAVCLVVTKDNYEKDRKKKRE